MGRAKGEKKGRGKEREGRDPLSQIPGSAPGHVSCVYSLMERLQLQYGSNSTWLDSTRHVRLCRASRASRAS